jgi:hypothetical protein
MIDEIEKGYCVMGEGFDVMFQDAPGQLLQGTDAVSGSAETKPWLKPDMHRNIPRRRILNLIGAILQYLLLIYSI